MQLSVVVPTYNRPAYALQTVRALLPELIDLGGECLVVDQSEPALAAPLEEALKAIPEVHYLRLAAPSLPVARNLGVQASRGRAILFLDDDVVPGPGLLRAHIERLRDPTVGCVGGKVTEAVPGRNVNTRRPGTRVSWLGRVYRNYDYDEPVDILAPPGANMSFRVQTCTDIGPFDVNYTGNATLEETDYGYRVREAGHRVVFEPQAALVHLAAPSGGCRLADPAATEISNFRNLTRFYLTHKGWWLFPLYVGTSLAVFLKRTRDVAKPLQAIVLFTRAVREGVRSYRSDRP